MLSKLLNWLKALLGIEVDVHEQITLESVSVTPQKAQQETKTDRKTAFYLSRKYRTRVGEVVARKGHQVVLKMTARNGESYFVKRASERVFNL